MSMLAITGGRVWIHDGATSVRFEPRTVWIRGGRVVEVLPGPAPAPGARADVERFDATGKFVCPSFIDAHFHLVALAHKMLRCDLSAASSAADIAARLAAHAASGESHGREPASAGGADPTRPPPEAEPPRAIVGVDFDESEWDDATLPIRADLNAVSDTRPVYARRVCCHIGVANDVLLRALSPRVPARFVDLESGRITEEAVFEANRLTRPPDEAVARALDGAIANLHTLGITAIHDIVDPDTIDVYVTGLRASRRPLRIDAYLHGPASGFQAARERFDAARPSARAVGVKVFADGSLGARTAALHEPYADADTRGELLVERRALAAELVECARRGIACAVHAIGDRALATVLDAVDDARAATGEGARLRVEHAEVIAERDVERIVRLRVPLVMQPNFVRNWGGQGGLYERRLGRERWRRHNPFATLLRSGGRVLFSSDGMPPGPLYGLKGATHHAVEGERVTAVEAYARYMTAARAMWTPGRTPGGIEPGRPADLVVLSGHPLLADTDRLHVEATFAAGEAVFRAPSTDARKRRASGA
jgi:hypothetical protein